MQARITLLPGDGVGPEIVAEARKILDAVAQRCHHDIEWMEGLIGGCAIDQTGQALPSETVDLCRQADAVLLGAVGGPKWDDPSLPVRPEAGLLGIRKALGLYANLRPTTVNPLLAWSGPVRGRITRNVDLLVVRELTGGIYFGERGRQEHPSGEIAFDTEVYTTGEIERIVRLAAQKTLTRRGHLTSVDKANVLETSRLWRATAERIVRDEFPDVTLEHMLVDAAAMNLIRKPAQFDVMVTSNMFGDILTDEASILTGSIGMLPSASLGDEGVGLFEPIHGSAPDIAGKGVVNPIGMILSVAMMCRESLGWTQEAVLIESAVEQVIADGARTADIARRGEPVVGTAPMGSHVAKAILSEQVPIPSESQTQRA